jgi:ComF family protein
MRPALRDLVGMTYFFTYGMKIVSKIVGFFFPPECLGCGTEDFFICPECVTKIPGKIQKKSFHLKYFERVFVLTDYENPLVEKAVKKLKFHYSKRILTDLFPFFQKHFPKKSLPANAVFVPVPLYFLRKNKRGCNQSELIARIFARIYGDTSRVISLLKRIKNTPHQSHLSKEERERNVKDAFAMRAQHTNIPKNTPLILVDDVTTTGSTLLECAKTLKKEGFDYVWAVVIARGK